MGGLDVITRIIIRGGQEIRQERRCYYAIFKDGGRDHESRNMGGF